MGVPDMMHARKKSVRTVSNHKDFHVLVMECRSCTSFCDITFFPLNNSKDYEPRLN